MTANIKVRTRQTEKKDSTSLSLLVESASQQTLEEFNPSAITQALINELSMTEDRAKEITAEVVKDINMMIETKKLTSISTSMIRSLVNSTLYELGTKKELKSAQDITISTSDITTLVEQPNNENGNLIHNPESINFTLAERVIKEYALKTIYPKESAKAHLEGKIHIHDLGAIRAYCSGHSVEYLKLNGLRNIPNISSTSAPANSAWTLARHLCSVTQFYSSIFAGAIGWEAINVFFAPLLVGWSQKKLKQLAQTIIFDLSQLAGAKGGQTSFTDFNVYITVPLHYRDTLAIGKSGKFVGLNHVGDEVYFNTRAEVELAEKNKHVTAMRYRHFEKEAQNFAKAILSVVEEGDAAGLPFAFPKINLHVNEDVFNSVVFIEGKGYATIKNGKTTFHKTVDALNEALESDIELQVERTPNIDGQKILMAASKASSKSGCPYFIFDRDGAGISQCPVAYNETVMYLSKKTGLPAVAKIGTLEPGQVYDVYADGTYAAGILKRYDDLSFYKIMLKNKHSVSLASTHLNLCYVDGEEQTLDTTTIASYLNAGKEVHLPYSLNKYESTAGSYDLGYFVGCYAGGGSLDYNGVIFSLNKEDCKQGVIQKLIDIGYNMFGAKHTIYESEHKELVTLCISSPALVGICKDFVVAKQTDKHYSKRVYAMSKEFRQGVFEGHYDTDGSDPNRIYTSSEKMRDSLIMLATTLGTVTSVTVDARPGRLGTAPSYCVLFYALTVEKYKNLYFMHNNRCWIPIEAIEAIPDRSVGYCFTMLDQTKPVFTLMNSGVLTHNCRLKITFSKEDMALLKTPEELRFVGVQNVSINLPGCALDAQGNEKAFYKELEHRMRLAMKAHVARTAYLEKLMLVKNSPLSFYAKGMDGKPYVDFKRGSYLIGIVGLNECVHDLIGKELHEDSTAHLKGLEIISHMKGLIDKLGKEYNMAVKLEETPAESTANRFAVIDERRFGDKAFIKRNDAGTYYSNSIHFAYDSDMDYMERLEKQSAYHTMIDAGAMIHLWVGEKLPDPKSIYALIEHTWKNTACVQWVISPEYTTCSDCFKTTVGMHDTCPHCNSDNVFHVTRVTGYYVKVEGFNKGKKAEFKDRNRPAYVIK